MFQKLKLKIFMYLTKPRMLPYYDNNIAIKDTRISSTVEFIKKDQIKIEENVFIWHNTILDGSAGLTISEGCQIGSHVAIFTHSSHISIRLFGKHYSDECHGRIEDGYILKEVHVGSYTFIATGSVILPGVHIGKGCIVSANSLVNQDVPDYAIVQGNPAKIIGDTRRLDKRYLKRDKKFEQYYNEWSDVES